MQTTTMLLLESILSASSQPPVGWLELPPCWMAQDGWLAGAGARPMTAAPVRTGLALNNKGPSTPGTIHAQGEGEPLPRLTSAPPSQAKNHMRRRRPDSAPPPRWKAMTHGACPGVDLPAYIEGRRTLCLPQLRMPPQVKLIGLELKNNLDSLTEHPFPSLVPFDGVGPAIEADMEKIANDNN